MTESEAMLATVGLNITEETGVEYPVHVRVDNDAVYVDIHVGDTVYATLIPWVGLIALSKYIDDLELKLPDLLDLPKKEYLN